MELLKNKHTIFGAITILGLIATSIGAIEPEILVQLVALVFGVEEILEK